MNLFLIHNFHRSGAPSGDDMVFKNEVNLLRKSGHHVIVYERHNDELYSARFFRRIAMWIQALWSLRSYRDVTKIIKREHPDIVHLHNIFPLVSPSAYSACLRAGIPVVQTLHDFRFFCPVAFFSRNGRVCEECVEIGLWRSIVHGCFRNSHLQSIIVALILGFHKIADTWQRTIDLFICLTASQRRKCIEFGLPGY